MAITRKSHGCNCNDCEQKYPCSRCKPCVPLNLCLTFTPDEVTTGPYNEELCCFTPKSARMALTMQGHGVFVRPFPPPPQEPTELLLWDWPFCPVTYNGNFICGDIQVSITITLVETEETCTFVVSIRELRISTAEEETFEHSFTDPAVIDTFSTSFLFDGNFISGQVVIGEAEHLRNDKYRRACAPNTRGDVVWASPVTPDCSLDVFPPGGGFVAEVQDFEECDSCPPCKNCRCLPKYFCIGYFTGDGCEQSIQWKRLELDPDSSTGEVVFNVTPLIGVGSGTPTTRTVEIDFCRWLPPATGDNPSLPPSQQHDGYTEASLFNGCLYNLRISEVGFNENQGYDETSFDNPDSPNPGRTLQSSQLCLEVNDAVQDRQVFHYVDPSVGPISSRQERITINWGWCGCDERLTQDLNCLGACSQISLAASPSCNSRLLFASFDFDSADSCDFDGLIVTLGRPSLTDPDFPVFSFPAGACQIYSGRTLYSCNGFTISFIVNLYYLPGGCEEAGSPAVPSQYRANFTISSACPGALGLVVTGVVPDIATCDPFLLQFNMPALIPQSPGDPACGCCDSLSPFIIRITL